MEPAIESPRSACIPQCCCGREECAYLAHSKKLLDSLERDTRTAGELGQALLIRHESYVADAEQDRRRMEQKLEILEQQKRELEGRNQAIVEENRRLLDQLESLNSACAESELKVLSMTELLRSTDQEMERLNALAARAENLQTDLARLEDEQASLHATIATTKEEEHAVLLRWQKAERTILSLQDQIDKIEMDAREERERHAELVGRMERRRAVEAELRNAQPRGSLARNRNSMHANENSGSVVSHFVKDILQDNANLQLGIVELKEMLDRSNEEVERLRQVMDQPEPPTSPLATPTPTLGAELNAKELHVHHHYHAPAASAAPTPRASRSLVSRKARKKHLSLASGSSSGYTTPRSTVSAIHSPARGSATSAILSQTSVTIPQSRNQRWSMQSNQTGFTTSSSLPSSPYTDSVFDRVFSDIGTELSRPTSPESGGAPSPFMTGSADYRGHQRSESIPRLSLDGAMRTSSEGTVSLSQQLSSAVRINGKGKAKRESFTPDFDAWQAGHSTILEENEDLDGNQELVAQESQDENSEFSLYKPFSTKLRRAASHESLLSISGMDIHTLQSRPSQLLAGHRLLSSSPTSAIASSQAVLSGTSAAAVRPTMSRFENDSRSYLSNLAANQRKPLAKKTSVGNLGQKVGGWVRGRWGYAAAAPPSPLQEPAHTLTTDTASIDSAPKSIKSASSIISASGAVPPEPRRPSIMLRSPGINQPGPIFGFAPEPKLPKKVISTGVDEESLRECLEN